MVVACILLLVLIVVGTMWYLRRQARLEEELANKPGDDDDDAGAISFSFVQGRASKDTLGGFDRRASSTDAGDDPTYGGLSFVSGAAQTNQAGFGEVAKTNAIFDGSTSETTYMDQGPWQGGADEGLYDTAGVMAVGAGDEEAAYMDTHPNPVEEEGAYLDTVPEPEQQGAAEDESAYLDTAPEPENPDLDLINEMAAMEATGDDFIDEVRMPSFDGGVEFDGFEELAAYDTADNVTGGGDPTYATAMGDDALYDTAAVGGLNAADEALYDTAMAMGGGEGLYDTAMGGPIVDAATYDSVLPSAEALYDEANASAEALYADATAGSLNNAEAMYDELAPRDMAAEEEPEYDEVASSSDDDE